MKFNGIPKAFESMEAWLHQDARANGESYEDVIQAWVNSLSKPEKTELRPFLQNVLDQVDGYPSGSKLMRLYARNWHVTEKTLKLLFRDTVLNELDRC